LSLPLRCISAALTPIFFFTSSMTLDAAAPATGPSPRTPVAIPPLAVVHVNRTLPQVSPSSGSLEFSSRPTDAEISQASVSGERLIPSSLPISEEENTALAHALIAHSKRNQGEDVAALEAFLAANPKSRWRISLLTGLATNYFKTGYFSKALAAWEEAWTLGKSEKEPALRAVVDQAVAELAKMNGRIGRFDRLETLFGEIGNREIRGSATEFIVGAKDALWLMKNRPEESFRCGPIALGTILATAKGNPGIDPKVDEFKSTSKGTSLAQVAEWAKQLGLNYQIARREVGAAVITPSLVHWKVGHYAAIARNEDGKLHVQDPTFAEDLWISPEALDAEASGYFLVPVGKLPAGWSSVSLADAKGIWGKGQTSGNDPDRDDPSDKKTGDDCGSSDGMARYNVHAMLVSLNITDTPIFYNVPVGPSANFTLTYNQRESHQPATFDYANFGNKWTCNLVSYITDDSTSPSADAKLFVQGGGMHIFKGFNSGTSSYAPEYRTQAVLVRTGAIPISYELRTTDGSKQIFNVPNGTVGAGRKVFLAQTIDPMGNVLTYSYSGTRIIGVTDAKGQVSTIEYKSTAVGSSDYYRIGKVTNPFGKFATFAYNTAGQLSAITDMIGIQSVFQYGTGDFIKTLTTPYGATNFAYGDSGTTPLPAEATRWIEITDPLGGKERVEYRINAPGFDGYSTDPAPPAMQSPGAGSYYLGFRNTFYWSKKAMMEAPGDYTKAKIIHWLHSSAGLTSGTVESEKGPFENRVYYLYKSQGSSVQEGPNELLVAKGRKLDDGTDQIYQFDYNSVGRVTKMIDPLARTTTYKYDTNNIDLLEIYQQNPQGAGTDPFGIPADKRATYTYNGQHEPLTSKDASGQTTTITYNAQGQLLTVENPKHEITTCVYDSVTGYLTSVTGALPGSTTSFTYDGYGRQRTVTDLESYTVTIDYDSLNRVTTLNYPDGTYEQIIYDRLDPEWKRDRMGRWTHNFYNALQNLVGVEDAALRFTRYNWCTCGSLESIVDPNGNKTTWTRDLQARVTSKVYADNSVISYVYENTTNRLKSMTDPKNQRTNYSYFMDDDLKQISYTSTAGQPLSAPNIPTASVNFTYDPVYNRVITRTDGTGLTTHAYNPVPISPTLGAGMLASTDGPLPNDTISYGYDELGRSTTRSINGAVNQSSTQYDALGRAQSTTNPLGTFNYAYVNTTGRIDHVDYPSGQKTQYAYFDNLGDQRLRQIRNLDPPTGVISQFDYTYNAVGNIMGWAQANSGQTAAQRYDFGYDGADQLRSAVLKDANTQVVWKDYRYDYDDAGNRKSEQIDSATTSFWNNNLNQLDAQSAGGTTHFTGIVSEPAAVTVNGVRTSVDGGGHFDGTVKLSPGTNTVSIVATDANGNVATKRYQVTVPSDASKVLLYDLNGNLTQDNARTYEWDAANRCVAINAGTHRTEMSHDGQNREIKRMERENGTVITTRQFIWCGWERCEERDESNAVSKRFYPQGEQINGNAYFYSRDHLGSVRELSDIAGATRARYDYDLWGHRSGNLITSNAVEADFGFTGHYVNSQYPELAFAPLRIYNTSLGRWLSRDPIAEEGGLNLYGYVFNNPTNGTDRSGLYVTYSGDWSDADAGNFNTMFAQMWATTDGRKYWEDQYSDCSEHSYVPDASSGGPDGGATRFIELVPAKPANSVVDKIKALLGMAGGQPRPPKTFIEPTNPPSNPPTPENLPPGHTVRIGPKTQDYPTGYWKQYDAAGRAVNPGTGKPPTGPNLSRPEFNAQTHVRMPGP
jgi:RHS repeat-associated protein